MAIKDKEEWTNKLTKACEAFGNYMRRDENPPEKKAVDKATEAIARGRRPSSPSVPKCSSCTPTYLRRKLVDLGARFYGNRLK